MTDVPFCRIRGHDDRLWAEAERLMWPEMDLGSNLSAQKHLQWLLCWISAVCRGSPAFFFFLIINKALSIHIEGSLSNPLSLPMSPPLSLSFTLQSRATAKAATSAATAVESGRCLRAPPVLEFWVTVGRAMSEQWRGRISGFVLQRPLTSSWISGVRKSRELLRRSSSYFSARSGWREEVSSTWFLIMSDVRHNIGWSSLH